MHPALFYLPGDRLMQPELSAARLDGHVVEMGEGYIPADVVEGPEARAAALRSLIALEDGEPFVYEAYDEAKPKLVAAVEAAGYAHARMEGKLAADRVRDEAIIRLEFTPGPLARFGPVRLKGVEGGRWGS